MASAAPRARVPRRDDGATGERSSAADSRLSPRCFIGIVGVAFAIRCVHLASIRHAPFFGHLLNEPARYWEWATRILQGQAPLPPFDEALGYPYFVAGIRRVLGDNVMAVALLQSILDALGCGIVALGAGRLFGRRAALVAGMLTACYGPLIYFAGRLEPMSPFVFLTVVATWLALDVEPRWTVVGAVWALALLVRVESLLALPILVTDAGRRGGSRAALLLLAPIVLFLACSFALNVRLGGRPVLLTSGPGLILWLANGAGADGVDPYLSPERRRELVAVAGEAHDEDELDGRLLRRVVSQWTEHPSDAGRLLLKKVLWTFNDRELSNTADEEWELGKSALHRVPFFPLGFGMVLPLAAAGGVLLGRAWMRALPLAAPLLVAFAGCTLTFASARFRLVGAPPLAMLAAYTLVQCATAWRTAAQRPRWALAAFAMLGGAALAWSNPFEIESFVIPELLVNRAILSREAGDAQGAATDLRQVLAIRPDDAIASVHLGLVEEQLGEDATALGTYLDGVDHAASAAGVPYLENVEDDSSRRILIGRAAALLRRRGGDLDALRVYVENPDVEGRRARRNALVSSLSHAP